MLLPLSRDEILKQGYIFNHMYSICFQNFRVIVYICDTIHDLRIPDNDIGKQIIINNFVCLPLLYLFRLYLVAVDAFC